MIHGHPPYNLTEENCESYCRAGHPSELPPFIQIVPHIRMQGSNHEDRTGNVWTDTVNLICSCTSPCLLPGYKSGVIALMNEELARQHLSCEACPPSSACLVRIIIAGP